jgi:peptide/nickel transport system ATP-binding protein
MTLPEEQEIIIPDEVGKRLLTVNNLRTHYYTDVGTVKAADGVSFTLNKGESIGIAGESGCGKTTVAMSLMRLIKGGDVVGGDVVLGGEYLFNMSHKTIEKDKVALIADASDLSEQFTVWDQLMETVVTSGKYNPKTAGPRTEKILTQAGVDLDKAQSYPRDLDEDTRLRVQIAVAIAKDPNIVMSGSRVIRGGASLLDMSMNKFRRIRWDRISLVSQAAMGALNPVYTVGGQIVEAIRTHRKCSKQEAWAQAEDLLGQVKVDPKRARNFPHELSGGMRQRAMIAMALACSPEIIIADEMTTALDVVTQAQVLKLLIDLQKRLNLSLIYISHELSVLGQACDKMIIMYAGKIVEIGPTAKIFGAPKHPYTQKLLSSLMDIHSDCNVPESIPGKPPNLINPPEGCRFWPRCSTAQTSCESDEPRLVEVAPEQFVACHHLT